MFSVIHPSARPEKWQAVYDAWVADASDLSSFEYILVCDKGGPFSSLPTGLPNLVAVWNTGRHSNIAAVNVGAKVATGDVLITAADDQFPCKQWDLKLAEILSDSPDKEVVEVSTGTPKEHERGLLVVQILTRARYERFGYLLYPEYESMYADNDFCELARRDGAIADARHLVFPHFHPFFYASVPSDKVYEAQNRPEAYHLGAAIFAMRRATNFGDLKSLAHQKRKKLCILYPGEMYSGRWVSHFLNTMGWLQSRFELEAHAGYSSNVYLTRHILAKKAVESDAEYVLWIDDDNLVDPPHVEKLIKDLDIHPDIDVIAGWCGCHAAVEQSPVIRSSVGTFGEDRNHSIPVEQLLASQESLMKIDWTGFPLVLMRRESLAKLDNPFAPILNPQNVYGFDSEDIAFSRRAKEAGLVLAVDPRVRVPHLKLRDADVTDGHPVLAGISGEGEI